jgi:beta-lactamase class C
MSIKHYIIVFFCSIATLLFFMQGKKKQDATPTISAANTTPASEIITVSPAITSLLSTYESKIDSMMEVTALPGAAIAIVKDSTIIYMKGFGVRDVNTSQPVDEHTVFRIASVSKSFSSFLTSMLVADQTLTWNDPISKFLPEFSLKHTLKNNELTIKHVLSHTTGLPYHTYTNLVESGMPLADMLDQLKSIDVSTPIGTQYSYQNVAYSLIGEVIHRSTGKSFEEMMQERVFKPLGMHHASMNYQSIVENTNHASPHKKGKTQWMTTKINNTYYNVGPAGGINASISDMAQWMLALTGKRPDVIDTTTLHDLFTPVVKAPSKNKYYGRMQRHTGSYYGLGWRILEYPTDKIIYHGGYVNGFRSEIAVDPKENLAICILTNGAGDVANQSIPLFFKLFHDKKEMILSEERKSRNLEAL